MKTYYYLYRITNLVNNKIYVGVHKTTDINDGYMGSGKVICSAIEKCGIDNFKKEILEWFTTSEEMFAKEKEVVTEEFLQRKDVYNLRRGGTGGFDYINKNIDLRIRKNKKARQSTDLILEHRWGINWRSILGKLGCAGVTAESKLKRKQTLKNRGIKSDASFMQTTSAAKTRKETFKRIGHQQGEKNSSFGTIWITNGIENKKIKKLDLIPASWNRGRNM